MLALGTHLYRHVAFYEDNYGQHVTGVHEVGRWGASILETVQSLTIGRMHLPQKLVIGWLSRKQVDCSVDLGAGRFSGRHRPGRDPSSSKTDSTQRRRDSGAQVTSVMQETHGAPVET